MAISDLNAKLRILSDAAKYDASCAASESQRPSTATGLGSLSGAGICHSFTPDGRCVSLLKLLLTNHCVYDCRYCVNRVSSDIARARFSPEEIVDLTLSFYRRNYIEGLFLSSGIYRSPDDTMVDLIRVARSLRQDHEFNGYIHLKVIPGSAPDLLAQAGRWADRVSANIELPTDIDLMSLAPDKNRRIIETSMAHIQTNIQGAREASAATPPPYAPAGQTTQMVVGATGSTDTQILTTASGLYGTYGLRRVYYSSYSPYPHADPRLPVQAPALLREHRLYQADWLMRHYGFNAHELTTEHEPNLSWDHDPKLAWALRHRDRFPVDLNRADRELLLRVPGLGYRNVDRILSIRRYHRLTTDDLKRLHVPMARILPFIITADRITAEQSLDGDSLAKRLKPPRQLSLFTAAMSAHSGQI
ncbi:MAG TPA: putative DNA modification/repair radical SAM protein [Nitrospira sp.]|nr:putative DNA modification/repair radical SAM protein [Nitrospira sp.]